MAASGNEVKSDDPMVVPLTRRKNENTLSWLKDFGRAGGLTSDDLVKRLALDPLVSSIYSGNVHR